MSAQQVNAPPSELKWGADEMGLFSDDCSDPASLTNITGTLYSFKPGSVCGTSAWELKGLATAAFNGWRPLIDVSSPNNCNTNPSGSNCLGSTATSYYKYCYAYQSNECYSGSTAGTVYVNTPNITTSTTCTTGNAAPFSTYSEGHLCFIPQPAYADALSQIGLGYPNTQNALRSLGYGLTPKGYEGGFANTKVTPDGKWLMAETTWPNGRSDNLEFEVPLWAPESSPNRTDFIQVPIRLTPPSSFSANNAIIEFGYDTNFYCQSRQEMCVAASSTYSQATPFWFETSDAALGNWNGNGVACSTGCTIIMPVLSGHVAYYRWKYRNASNQVLATGPTQVVAEN